ncbi:radical SAM protein [Alphaproteobacteria bacterium HT1-32]|nr:radical SAM protein [Alphaproteobacteria bacterium HT1-32]
MATRSNRPVILVYPDTDLEMPGTYALPLSVLAVASALYRDYEVVIFDQRTDPESKYSDALQRNPIAVGISTMTGTQLIHSMRFAGMAKDLGIPTIWGNWHPTLLPEQTAAHPLVDYVITHEGEETFAHLIREIEAHGSVDQKIWRGVVEDWNSLPPVPYHLVDCEQYLFNAQFPHARVLPFTFSRGCPFQCAYCATGNMLSKWRPLAVQSAVERMMELVERHDLDMIKFTDENITTNKKVFAPLAEEIGGRFGWMIQSRLDCIDRVDLDMLERNGLRLLSAGLESGSPRILKLIKKKETLETYHEVNRKLGQTGIRCTYNFMMAFPGETWEDMMMTVDLGLRMIDDNPNAFLNPYYTFVPYPGCNLSEQFEHLLPQDLEGWAQFDRFNAQTPFSQEFQFEISNIAFSSKYVGRRFLKKFPGNDKVADLTDRMTWEWRRKNFTGDVWHRYREENAQLMKDLFGDFAFDAVIKDRQKVTNSDHDMQKFAERKEPDGKLPYAAAAVRPRERNTTRHGTSAFVNVGSADY